MSILVAVVSYSHSHSATAETPFGFKALKPSISIYPQFLEMLVSRLSSGDHILGANALQLVNALMRDALTNDADADWSKFIKKLQDLGVIKAVWVLMQSTALTDLAAPLLDFQQLTKIMLKKWRDVRIDMEKTEHRRALKALETASWPERGMGSKEERGTREKAEKWRRLGFETEHPAWEFDSVGFLGMMDVTDFVRKDQDQYQKLLLEQSNMSPDQRCPLARASLSVTSILYEHFEVEKAEEEDTTRYAAMLELRTGFDTMFRPLLLHWSRLHTAGLNAFLRLWKTTGAEVEDFDKVEDLVRILVEQVVGGAPRIKEMQEIEDELADFDYQKLRELQMELLELSFEDAWGHHLRQVRDELHHEALQFIKEQRIRCLLQGDWFPHIVGYDSQPGPVTKQQLARNVPSGWRYVRLSHNRRYLHYADFENRTTEAPSLDVLHDRIDLSIVSSVDSKVSTSRPSSPDSSSSGMDGAQLNGTTPTPNGPTPEPGAKQTASISTTLTIHGYLPMSAKPTSRNAHGKSHSKGHNSIPEETVLLTLHPQSHTFASEWLDGLLMLLNQQPITNDTNKLVRSIEGYGLRIRLLNVRFEDGGLGLGDGEKVNGSGLKHGAEMEIPSRDGIDEDYYYDIAGM